MRTITQEDARLHPQLAEFVGKTLSNKEINEIINAKDEKKEGKKEAKADK